MPTEAAAPSAPAAEGAQGLPDNPSAAAARYVEKAEAKKVAPTEKVEAKPEAPAAKEPKKPRVDPNLVKREREATEASRRAAEIEAKYKPLTESLARKDIKGALAALAEYGVTFADVVEVLTNGEDKGETTEQTAARVAREAIDKAKAEDAKRAEAAAAEKKAADEKDFDARLAKFRAARQAQAEADPARWKHTSVTGTGEKAWDALASFHEATNGGRLNEDDGLDIVEEAWDLVHGTFAASKRRMPIDEAISAIVADLAKLGVDKAREKLKASRNPSAADNGASKQTGSANGGRADGPSISNRTTSGAPGVVPRRDPNAQVRFDKSAVNDAIRRALPHLADA